MNRAEASLMEAFNEYFLKWSVTFPQLKDLAEHESGQITTSGWWINYRFGRDGNGRWLEFYGQNRKTNDRHVRFHENGNIEKLPTLDEPVIHPEISTLEEKGKIDAAAQERFLKLYQELQDQHLI